MTYSNGPPVLNTWSLSLEEFALQMRDIKPSSLVTIICSMFFTLLTWLWTKGKVNEFIHTLSYVSKLLVAGIFRNVL